MKILVLVMMLATTAPALAQTGTETRVKIPAIETTYDNAKDKTTVRMTPMQISGEKGRFHSLHLAPAYSFPGQVPQTPEIIDFELQTVVKAHKLSVDLYVLFIIDGEEIFLSSNRWAVRKPVPGRPWVGERLVFRMPFETLLKLANSKQAHIRLGAIPFELGETHLSALRVFAETSALQTELS